MFILFIPTGESYVPKILAFSGSARKASYNQRLVRIAASAAEQAGTETKIIDLADFPMPIFNQDFESEQGMPDGAREFKRLLIEHEGFLIASPEYNSAFSPLLKNAIDWASRSESDEEPPLIAYRGKVAAIMSASPGALGGLRGLVYLRMMLGNLGVLVLPKQQTVPRAAKAFGADGQLLDNHKQELVLKLGVELAQTLDKLKG